MLLPNQHSRLQLAKQASSAAAASAASASGALPAGLAFESATTDDEWTRVGNRKLRSTAKGEEKEEAVGTSVFSSGTTKPTTTTTTVREVLHSDTGSTSAIPTTDISQSDFTMTQMEDEEGEAQASPAGAATPAARAVPQPPATTTRKALMLR